MTGDLLSLGQTEIRLSSIGMGASQWGDKYYWGYGRDYHDSDIRAAFEAVLQAGINWVDTAEVYGPHTSERILGRLMRELQVDIRVATKCFPLPWRWSGRTLLGALKDSLQRLGLDRVDLYQMHWPYPPASVESWMDGMAEAARRGLVCAIGVSNYNADQVRRASDRLAKHGLALASNQIQYSLLHRTPERDGAIDACRERGVTVIAYSPIAKGMLTGKYTPSHAPRGLRGRLYSRGYLARVQPLIGVMREIGQAHSANGNAKTPTQVALNWLICKGALPIPGAKNQKQARDNAGAMGWRMTDEEVKALDDMSDKLQ